MTPLENQLAESLQSILNSLNGYKNCPAIQAMIADAKAPDALAAYDATRVIEIEQKAERNFQLWLRANYPDLWLEWVGARTSADLWYCINWTEAHYPEVRQQFVSKAQLPLDTAPQKPYNGSAQTGR